MNRYATPCIGTQRRPTERKRKRDTGKEREKVINFEKRKEGEIARKQKGEPWYLNKMANQVVVRTSEAISVF